MSTNQQTPVSQVYSWEPSNAAIAARYGLRAEDILRFDTNTSPLPPDFLPDALRGPFQPTLNEYPDSSYADLTAAAAAYTRAEPHSSSWVPVPTKSSTSWARRFCQPVPRRSFRSRPTRCTASSPHSGRRGSFRCQGWVAGRASHWTSTPSSPSCPKSGLRGCVRPTTRPPAKSPRRIAARIVQAAAQLPDPPLSSLTRLITSSLARPSSTGRRSTTTCWPSAPSRRHSRSPACVSDLASAHRAVIERLERVRPPGSISTLSAHVATQR